ncbi:hypothetical protein [Ohtaekwangia koreensis]|uniref:Lipoprotein n=1 Tax=Ohtaekwangia koreensis TaxID=688867 RepID=A0A1T5M8Q2_9BACT|nr:hypothetical protein [Ohtaekwangia koreensis]SKC84394.1 hypothetical protein SAMN05660236_4769 [Ohtaekwangia koreensis]
MTSKKLLIFPLFFVTLLVSNSCVSKVDKDEFHQTCENSDRLIVKRYDLGTDSSVVRNLHDVVWTNTITDSKRIGKINHLFSSVKDGGYCCCMKTHYTMTFYKNNTELGVYSVDTTEIKDKIVLYGKSYQTSYIVELKDLHAIISDK